MGIKTAFGLWRQSFPIELHLKKKFSNAAPLVGIYAARLDRVTIKNEWGEKDRFFVTYLEEPKPPRGLLGRFGWALFKGLEVRVRTTGKFDLPFYVKAEEVTVLEVLQIDEHNFLPCATKDGVETVTIPVWEKDAAGRIVVNAEGKPIPELKRDEKGELVMKDGKPIPTNRTEERVSFDSRIMLENGEVKSIPQAIAVRAEDEREAFASEIIEANRQYQTKSWLDKVLPYFLIGAAIVFTIIILVVGLNAYNDATSKNVEASRGIASAILNASQNFEAAARIMGAKGAGSAIATPFVPPA